MINKLKGALVGAGALGALISFAAPSPEVGIALQTLVIATALASVFVGLRTYQPTRSVKSHFKHPDPWALLGASALMRYCAELVKYFLGTPDHAGLVGSGFHAFFGLASVVLTGWAFVTMMRQRFGEQARDHAFEATISAGTISMLLWCLVIEPVLRMNDLPSSTGFTVAIGFTIACIQASLALHLTASFSERQPSFLALSVGEILLAASGIFSFIGVHAGQPVFISLGSAVPTAGLAFLVVGALEPSMTHYEESVGPAGARLDRRRLTVLISPVVLGPALLSLCLTGKIVLAPLAIASYTICLSLLVVGHLISMVQARASSTHWASHDKLTGLPNRALFRERAAQALERSRKLGNQIAIMYLDLDRFKHVNDSMGHEAGDQLLEQVARRILSCVDSGDTVARLGGDEFAILLPGVEDDRVPRLLARRLLKTFSAPFNLRPRPIFMSPSLGIAVSEGQANLETILTQADTAMYRAKEGGRNSYAVWSHKMSEASKQRLVLETALHSAVSNKELRLVYQPKVELVTGRVVGLEALLRWHNPKLGDISPEIFIQLAEESGLINQIGAWVLETACMQAKAWSEAGFANLSMAVNLSSRQFQSVSIPDLVSSTLRQTGLAPQLLELELTETVAMAGDKGTISTLRELREMGVKTSIDDFGTGYSNLSYLSRFPIDNLKIDKSFVQQIDKSGGDAAIIVAIIAMAHGLGLRVIAEGVETHEQAEFLASHDCDQMQGYLFSPPLEASQVESLLMLEHVSNGTGRLQLPKRNEATVRFERPDSTYDTPQHQMPAQPFERRSEPRPRVGQRFRNE